MSQCEFNKVKDLFDQSGKPFTQARIQKMEAPPDVYFRYMQFLHAIPNTWRSHVKSPSSGVYVSQIIKYTRYCSYYDDFRYRHKCLVDRLLSQGHIALRLEKSFRRFFGRCQHFIEKYQRSVVNDLFPG